MAFDVYAKITERILEQLEKGVIPWRKPWIFGSGSNAAISHESGKAYSFLNQMLLGEVGEYLTYNQAKKEGGNVRKGEHGRMIVFWKPQEVKDEKAQNGKKIIPVLKWYTVFNINQCDGIEPRFLKDDPNAEHKNPIESAETIFSEYLVREGKTGLKVEREKKRADAFYQPSTDTVKIPMLDQFINAEEFYSTAFHELTHSTGAKHRLNRLTSGRFGSKDYAREELVAELGAAGLNNICGIETENSFTNSAAYIQSWSKKLKEDNRAIVWASGRAEKAIEFIRFGKAVQENA